MSGGRFAQRRTAGFDGLPTSVAKETSKTSRPTFLDLMQPPPICSVTGRALTLAKRLLNLEGKEPTMQIRKLLRSTVPRISEVVVRVLESWPTVCVIRRRTRTILSPTKTQHHYCDLLMNATTCRMTQSSSSIKWIESKWGTQRLFVEIEKYDSHELRD